MPSYSILRVDLGTGTLGREAIPKELIRSFVGGKGLAAHYLATELPAQADPLGPENVIIFMTGPVCGLFPGTCRHVVVTKSPATGGFNDTYAGGFWAWELRKLGLLGIIVTGKAKGLTYLEVTGEGAFLRDASPLAGKGIDEVDDHPAFSEHRVLAIGPAGENRVAFAAIGNNAGRDRKGRSGYNGRGGAGAVMGAKNLKAIVLRGSGRPELPEAARRLRRTISAQVKAGPAASPLAEVGTTVGVDMMNAVHVLPTRNFRAGSFEGVAGVNHEPVAVNVVAHEGCFNCPVRCGVHVRAPEGAFPGAETKKLEYETIGMGASNTGNADFSSIVRFSDLCDSLGLDTISTGAAVAFAMDCSERGLIDSPLRFGDAQGQAGLVLDIAYRRGLGAALADGIRSAAKAWGVDPALVSVFQVKNLEFPAYDPRGSVGMGLAFATSDRGACHNRSWPISREALDPEGHPFDAEGKAALVVADQDGKSPKWSMIFCDFLGYGPDDALAMLAALGLDLTREEYDRMGRRIWNLIRLINLREGWTAAADALPPGLDRPLEDSGACLRPEVFSRMKREYYALRGWDGEGRPPRTLIAELGLETYAVRLFPQSQAVI